jgi:hypothetical protein
MVLNLKLGKCRCYQTLTIFKTNDILSQTSAGMKLASHRIIAHLYNEEQKALDYRMLSSYAIKETEKGAA